MPNFGSKLKELRLAQNLSLRDVARATGYDASNWSKVERGLISPPDTKYLEKYLLTLKLQPESPAWQEVLDLADIARRNIPQDVLRNQDVSDFMPAFFRTVRKEKPTRENLEKALDLIRREERGA